MATTVCDTVITSGAGGRGVSLQNGFYPDASSAPDICCLSVRLLVCPSIYSLCPSRQKHTEGIRLFFHQCRLTSRQGLTRKHGRSNFAGTASSEHHRIRENLQQLSAHAIMHTPSRSIAQERCARMARQACSIANRMTEQFRRSEISRTL